MTEKVLRKATTLLAPISKVWESWTTTEGLKTFLGTDNKIELKPGGAFEIYFQPDAPEGQRGGEGNTIISFQPERELTFTWNAPPSIPEIRNPDHRTRVTVYFETVDPNHTKIVIEHSGWLEGKQWDETYTYFDEAWEGVLDALTDSFLMT